MMDKNREVFNNNTRLVVLTSSKLFYFVSCSLMFAIPNNGEEFLGKSKFFWGFIKLAAENSRLR